MSRIFSDFFPKTLFFSIVSGFWLKTVRTLIEKFPVVCLKRHSLRPEQKFEENGFLKIFFNFCHFRTFIEKQFGLFAKSHRELSKLHFRCPEELLVRMYFFIELLYSIPCLSDLEQKIFRTFVRRTPNALSELRSMCPKRSFDENVFRTLLFLILLGFYSIFHWLSDKILSAGSSKLSFCMSRWSFQGKFYLWKSVIVFSVLRFRAKNFDNVVKTVFFVSRGTVGVNVFFSKFVFYSLPCGLSAKIFFGLLLERLRTRCQNCVLCVQKEVLTKNFSKPCFFRRFRTLCEFLLIIW